MPILYRMLYTTALLCLVSLAQITSPLPEGTTVFTVTLKEGGEIRTVNAAINAKGEFLDYYDRLNAPSQLKLYLDEPWNDYPVITVTRLEIEDAQPEPAFQQQKRYDESGYVMEEVDDGVVWVQAETKQRYERMLALRAERDAAREQRIAAVSVAASDGEVVASGPGVAAKWGRHVVVIVLAVVSMVVVVRLFF